MPHFRRGQEQLADRHGGMDLREREPVHSGHPATLDGLRVDPCIPHTLAGYTVTRRYRGAVYHIRVENPHAVQKGVQSVTMNGAPIAGTLLPLAKAGENVEVSVILG